MPPTLTDPVLEYLLQNSGLTLTDAEKADLKTIHDGLAAMKARVRQKRGHMAELAHTFGFTPEDLT
jgi:nitrate reductase assembly molybdenum cofactor insertion protein NarJ